MHRTHQFTHRPRLVSGFVAVVIAVVFSAGEILPARAAPLRVVTTTEDLASLTREIGGDKVEVVALARGYQDPHHVDAKASFIMAVSRADLLIVVGRDLELGWLPALQSSSRNSKIHTGGSGYLDASMNVKILEIPTGQLTRAMGDVHAQGNPHYWLDPSNGRLMAQAIRDKLSALDPASRATYESRYADFDRRLAAAEKRWDAAMAPYKGAKIVTYHRSWPNFVERWGLNVIGYVEPKPGVPASPQHIIGLIAEMKRQNAKVIVVEPYWDPKTSQSIASQVGGRVLMLAPSVGGTKEAGDYLQLFDYNINTLVAALSAAK